jgi:protochlorophyllide reductase
MDSKGDERRVCVITGANSGIGFATALGMAQKGWQVVLACRSLPSAQEAVQQIRSQLKQGNSNEEGEKKEQSEEEDQSLVVMKLDLADLNSVDEFASAFQKRFTKLHALILNAGVVTTSKKQSAQGHELMFAGTIRNIKI